MTNRPKERKRKYKKEDIQKEYIKNIKKKNVIDSIFFCIFFIETKATFEKKIIQEILIFKC